MKKITVSVVTMLASLALMSPVYAAGESKESAKTMQGREMKAESSMLQAQSAKAILGMSVVSQNGKAIGKIQDIKFDTSSGKIDYVTVQKAVAPSPLPNIRGSGKTNYATVRKGGGMGIAVPLEAFQFTKKNARLTVDAAKLDTAPKQSNMTEQEFLRGLESHYGISPAWQEGRGTP